MWSRQVQDEKVETIELCPEAGETVFGLGFRELGDQVDDGDEANTSTLSAGGQSERRTNMALSGARRAHPEHHFVAGVVGAGPALPDGLALVGIWLDPRSCTSWPDPVTRCWGTCPATAVSPTIRVSWKKRGRDKS